MERELQNIVEYSKYKVEEILNRKQHIETKILSLLQATAVVATLITAFIPEELPLFNKLLYIISLIALILVIITLVKALNDGILKLSIIKIIMQHKYKITIDSWLYYDSPKPNKYLEIYRIYKNKGTKYYEEIIESFNITVERGNNINIAKNIMFNISLSLFIFSISIVLINSILIIVNLKVSIG